MTTFSYDAAGRIIQVLQRDPGGDVAQAFTYDYDAAGRRTRVIESGGVGGWDGMAIEEWSQLSVNDWSTLPVGGDELARVTWTYDPTGQLLAEHRSGANEYRTTYAYDPTGNRTVEENLVDGRITSTYDAANRLLTADSFSGITTYSYDAAGNRRTVEEPTGDLATYTWNAENQLTQIELPNDDVVTYVWSPVNKLGEERIVTGDDGVETTHLLWDNNNVLRETDDIGTPQAEYTYQPQPYGDLVSDRRDWDSASETIFPQVEERSFADDRPMELPRVATNLCQQPAEEGRSAGGGAEASTSFHARSDRISLHAPGAGRTAPGSREAARTLGARFGTNFCRFLSQTVAGCQWTRR